MAIIRVENFGGDSVARAELFLKGMPNGVEKAVKSAMPRAVTHLRKQSSVKIREEYDISAKNLRPEENIAVKYNHTAGLSANVLFKGYEIPLIRYKGVTPQSDLRQNKTVKVLVHGTMRNVHPGIAAKGHLKVGSPNLPFKNAFTVTIPGSGHTGVFERTGKMTADGSHAIHQLMGLSIPQMLGNREVQEDLSISTSDVFENRMAHEVNRLLNGWGGK